MRDAIIEIGILTLCFGLFSSVMIICIAWTHRPFGIKDFYLEIREIFKLLYEGIKPEKRKEK